MSVAEKKTIINELFHEGKEIDKALKRPYSRLFAAQKAGNPVAAWRDGKVVLIKPEDIVVEEKQK